MANVLSSDNLRKSYAAALEARAYWFDIWRLIVEDEWFRAELKGHAEFVIRSGGHTMQILDDVQQEVIAHLSGRLEKSVNLGHDPATVGEKFANWIGTIVLNECRDVLRRMHRGHESLPDQPPDEEEAAAVSAGRLQDQARELKTAIDELPEPHSEVLRMFLARHSISSIAKHLGLSYKQARAALRSGIDQLRNELS